jgi:ferredoxin-NADP reductase
VQLTLAKKEQIAPQVITFTWNAPEPVIWRAGQYGVFYLPHPNSDTSGPERFFTIVNPPYLSQVAFTTRISNSSYKQALATMQPGDTIELQSIGGEFVLEDQQLPLIFMASGIGITPFRSILRELDHQHQDIRATVLYQHRSNEVLFANELETLQSAHPQLSIIHLDRPDQINQTYLNTLPALHASQIYISGPIPIVEHLESLLNANRVDPGRIYCDYFEYDWSQLGRADSAAT